MTQGPDFEAEVVDVDPAALLPSVASFAPMEDRQGLFIHTFKCLDCALEFAIFSWWPDRHTVVNTACPECRRVTQKSHWLATVDSTAGRTFGDGPEIFRYSPVGPGPRLMPDCSLFTGLPDDSARDG